MTLRPFLRYEDLEWAPLVSGRRLRRVQMQFFCLKRYVYYLPGRVRHQFIDRFSIPIPPPVDMTYGKMTWAAAWIAAAFAEVAHSRFTIWEVSQVEYHDWFELVGKPYLFPEDLWAEQSKMWYVEDWTQVKVFSTIVDTANIISLLRF